MFQPWRIKLREAQTALRSGRLDEAGRLLRQSDLHHFQPSEVLEVVDAYLDAALEAGFREVRLIHGRGKGVQRARIRRRLTRDARVDHFEEAPPGRGGWGATLVWLKPR